jgi:hypothetical protein
MKQRAAAALAAILLLPLHPAGARGQIRASEHAVVAQTIDGTTITVEYSRPAARGRELFGATVPWGQPWTGANWATTIAADRDFRLGGRDVPAGKYSLWLIPRQTRWTLFLDPNARLFHVQRPDSTPAQIRVEVEPEQGPHVELLTWSFPAVSGDGATLRMQWGTTSVRLPIVVQPTRPVALTAEKRARYVGSYDMTIHERAGWPANGRLDVFEADGLLRARLPFPIHPGDELEFDLIPAGDDRFNAGLYRGGKLFNVEMGAALEFDVGGGRATAVRLRAIEGTVFMEGTRSSGDANPRADPR